MKDGRRSTPLSAITGCGCGCGFGSVAAEARAAGPAWQLLFTAALAGRTTASEIQRMLDLLVKRVEAGEFGGLLPFNPAGEAVFIG